MSNFFRGLMSGGTDVKEEAGAEGQGTAGRARCRRHGLTSAWAICETLGAYESSAAAAGGQTDVKSGRSIQNQA